MCTERVPSKPGTPYDARLVKPQVAHLQPGDLESTRKHARVTTIVSRRARCAASDVGHLANSQWIVAFWIGTFNANGHRAPSPAF